MSIEKLGQTSQDEPEELKFKDVKDVVKQLRDNEDISRERYNKEVDNRKEVLGKIESLEDKEGLSPEEKEKLYALKSKNRTLAMRAVGVALELGHGSMKEQAFDAIDKIIDKEYKQRVFKNPDEVYKQKAIVHELLELWGDGELFPAVGYTDRVEHKKEGSRGGSTSTSLIVKLSEYKGDVGSVGFSSNKRSDAVFESINKRDLENIDEYASDFIIKYSKNKIIEGLTRDEVLEKIKSGDIPLTGFYLEMKHNFYRDKSLNVVDEEGFSSVEEILLHDFGSGCISAFDKFGNKKCTCEIK